MPATKNTIFDGLIQEIRQNLASDESDEFTFTKDDINDLEYLALLVPSHIMLEEIVAGWHIAAWPQVSDKDCHLITRRRFICQELVNFAGVEPAGYLTGTLEVWNEWFHDAVMGSKKPCDDNFVYIFAREIQEMKAAILPPKST